MDNLWSEIVNKLIENNLTIATMESCTGGGIANEITSISGASAVIKESYVTYCNEAKIKQGVPAETIEKYTVYSQETAVDMAKAVKKQAGSNISVGITGQLGRIDPSNPVEKLNHVWFSISDKNNNIVTREIIVPDGDRKLQKEYAINEVATVASSLFIFVTRCSLIIIYYIVVFEYILSLNWPLGFFKFSFVFCFHSFNRLSTCSTISTGTLCSAFSCLLR